MLPERLLEEEALRLEDTEEEREEAGRLTAEEREADVARETAVVRLALLAAEPLLTTELLLPAERRPEELTPARLACKAEEEALRVAFERDTPEERAAPPRAPKLELRTPGRSATKPPP